MEEAEPDFSGAAEAFESLRALSYLGRFGGLLKEHRDKLKDTVIRNIEQGTKLTPERIARAQALRTELFHRMRRFLERYEFLLCPVKSCYYITIPSHPAISVPAGFTTEGSMPSGSARSAIASAARWCSTRRAPAWISRASPLSMQTS